MAYYATLNSNQTVDTNIPTSEASTSQKYFRLYATLVYDGEPAIYDSFYGDIRYSKPWWIWNSLDDFQNGAEYLAAQRVEFTNAKSKQESAEGSIPNIVKIKYFNDGIILLKGVYTGFPFYLDDSPATPLSTPTGLYADNITSDSARISWNAVENASDYKVEYRRQGDTTWNE